MSSGVALSIQLFPSYDDYRYFGFPLHVFISHPMYFVRSGDINLGQGSLQRAGYLALYWFATALPNNSTSAYNTYINPDIAYPDNSDNYNRRVGYPLHNPHFHHSSMYFVRSGVTYLTYGALRYSGRNLFLWSSTAIPAIDSLASSLNYSNEAIRPSDNSTRYYGFSLSKTHKINLFLSHTFRP